MLKVRKTEYSNVKKCSTITVPQHTELLSWKLLEKSYPILYLLSCIISCKTASTYSILSNIHYHIYTYSRIRVFKNRNLIAHYFYQRAIDRWRLYLIYSYQGFSHFYTFINHYDQIRKLLHVKICFLISFVPAVFTSPCKHSFICYLRKWNVKHSYH